MSSRNKLPIGFERLSKKDQIEILTDKYHEFSFALDEMSEKLQKVTKAYVARTNELAALRQQRSPKKDVHFEASSSSASISDISSSEED